MVSYFRPTELSQALAAMAERDLRILAGATDYFPAQIGRERDHDILDLTAIESLRGIELVEDYWRIGAMTTWRDLIAADLPACFAGLRAAARQVGGAQIQNTATIAGNLCNASPAADGVPPLLSLEAVLELRDRSGATRIALSDFILGNRRTALAPGQLVTAILVPKTLAPGRSGFIKLGGRSHLVISIAMVAGLLLLDGQGRIAQANLSIGACSEVAQRLPLLEQELVGQQPAGLRIRPEHFAHLSPLDDHRGTAVYRMAAAAVLTKRLLRDLCA